eukprot:Nk52_evm20s216 gene=Nk52_evmTU20s216
MAQTKALKHKQLQKSREGSLCGSLCGSSFSGTENTLGNLAGLDLPSDLDETSAKEVEVMGDNASDPEFVDSVVETAELTKTETSSVCLQGELLESSLEQKTEQDSDPGKVKMTEAYLEALISNDQKLKSEKKENETKSLAPPKASKRKLILEAEEEEEKAVQDGDEEDDKEIEPDGDGAVRVSKKKEKRKRNAHKVKADSPPVSENKNETSRSSVAKGKEPARNSSEGSQVENSDEEVYEVESIVSHFVDENNSLCYIVKWKGYPEACNTAEPSAHLENAPLIIKEYHSRQTLQNAPFKANVHGEGTSGSGKKAKLEMAFEKTKNVRAERSESEAEEEEIEKIVGHFFDKSNNLMYKVKWKGYSKEHNTVEPSHHLDNCPEVLEKYKKTSKGKELLSPTRRSAKKNAKVRTPRRVVKPIPTQSANGKRSSASKRSVLADSEQGSPAPEEKLDDFEEEKEGTEILEVEKIHDVCVFAESVHYLVEWRGYPERDDFTWEPDHHLPMALREEYQRERMLGGAKTSHSAKLERYHKRRFVAEESSEEEEEIGEKAGRKKKNSKQASVPKDKEQDVPQNNSKKSAVSGGKKRKQLGTGRVLKN